MHATRFEMLSIALLLAALSLAAAFKPRLREDFGRPDPADGVELMDYVVMKPLIKDPNWTVRAAVPSAPSAPTVPTPAADAFSPCAGLLDGRFPLSTRRT